MATEPPATIAGARRTRRGTALAAVLLAAGGGVMVVSTLDRPPLAVHGKLEEAWSFIDASGAPFSTSALRGTVWVASFVFTNCRDTCPCIAANLMQVQQALLADARLAGRVRLVSFSVDPERDGPQELRRFAARYGADPGLWIFLTAAPGVVANLAAEVFALPVGKAALSPDAEAAPEINHSDRLSLVDAEGRVRGYYRPEPEELRRLLRDIDRLVEGRAAVP